MVNKITGRKYKYNKALYDKKHKYPHGYHNPSILKSAFIKNQEMKNDTTVIDVKSDTDMSMSMSRSPYTVPSGSSGKTSTQSQFSNNGRQSTLSI